MTMNCLSLRPILFSLSAKRMGRGTMRSMVEGLSGAASPTTALRAVPLPTPSAQGGLALLALLFASAPALAAPAPRPAPAQVAHERLWLGSAWYPEQWPEERWEADLALM